MEKDKLYIAYGSNLNLEQMEYRCPTATIVGKSKINDYELVFRGSKTGSYATVEPCEGATVPVLIWKIKENDEKSLDAYEGYPRFYQKEDMVLNVNGKNVSAMAYIMPDTHVLGMPAKSYVDCILKGYESAGFDTDIFYSALENTALKIADEPQVQQGMFGMKGW